ncbi:MAG: substrate-binding domain-containing protein [Christensenellaceae bacterium]|jgi:ribose transport system substrate-binding protein|nr:substrate-binding domain-containing protein [Christensenellaceae bacterium]
MIGKLEKRLLAGIAILIGVLLLLVVYQNAQETGTRTYSISVLVHAPSERFKKGLEKAALDYNVDVHLITTDEPGNGEQQEAYLKRELQTDADAIVLEAEDAERMQAFLSKLSAHVPVVTYRRTLQRAGIAAHIGIDDYELGLRLGALIAARSPLLPCLLIAPRTLDSSMQSRLDGCYAALQSAGIASRLLQTDADGMTQALFAQEPHTLAVLDENLLQPLCQLAPATDTILGVGYVNGVRAQLESGRIAGLVVYSEFDMGYLSLQAAALCAARKTPAVTESTFYIADAETMYDAPVEQILFPID